MMNHPFLGALATVACKQVRMLLVRMHTNSHTHACTHLCTHRHAHTLTHKTHTYSHRGTLTYKAHTHTHTTHTRTRHGTSYTQELLLDLMASDEKAALGAYTLQVRNVGCRSGN